MLLWISLLTEMEISMPGGKKKLGEHEAILFKLGLTKQKIIKYMNILSHVYNAAAQLSESGFFFPLSAVTPQGKRQYILRV